MKRRRPTSDVCRPTGDPMPLPRMSITVDSRLECGALAGSVIHAFCRALAVSELESSQIEVCAVEAMNNCVVHAYRREAGHTVEFVVESQDGEIQITICDQGAPIDPQVLRRDRRDRLELDPARVESESESGRGLAIIQELMTVFEYFSAGGKNRLLMRKRFSAGPQV